MKVGAIIALIIIVVFIIVDIMNTVTATKLSNAKQENSEKLLELAKKLNEQNMLLKSQNELLTIQKDLLLKIVKKAESKEVANE